eukprot:GHRR01018874.1.p2 GENE.GHRR01018874.1~~GHRR01018874.1.p2  ORF type:complete len:122 (-),score=20.53 GHRR01018874.1:352-717(-)
MSGSKMMPLSRRMASPCWEDKQNTVAAVQSCIIWKSMKHKTSEATATTTKHIKPPFHFIATCLVVGSIAVDALLYNYTPACIESASTELALSAIKGPTPCNPQLFSNHPGRKAFQTVANTA